MVQHFLLSRAAESESLSLASIFTMKEEEAEVAFRRVRWADTDGEPVCPHCGGTDAYDCRRLKGAPRFRCRACVKDFSIASGTLFASHKLLLRCYLAAIAIFCNEMKGRRKPNPFFKRGTIFRAAWDVLRYAGKPLTASEATVAMLATKGIKNASAEAVRDLEGTVRASLRGSPAVIATGKHPTRWALQA